LRTPVEKLIAATAQKYTVYVDKLRKQGCRIHIFNVVPTGDFSGPDAGTWKKGLHYPFTVGYEERKYLTEQLNGAYAACCLEQNSWNEAYLGTPQ
jgi:hypothetical protein